jgi:hypothetical protein
MLKTYNKYLDLEVVNETHILTDPPGANKLLNSKTYSAEFSTILNTNITKNTDGFDKKINDLKNQVKALEKAKVEVTEKSKSDAAEVMVEKLKKDLKGKIIGIQDTQGRQKILEVNDVEVGKSNCEYYPVIVDDKDRKIRYSWESKDNKAKIFDIGFFLEFFEEHYIDKLLMFQGRPIKGGGGDQIRYIKHVVRIGVHNGTTQDFLIVENDDKTSQLLIHGQPIKIMDMKLKELDPYGEENWDQ